MSEQHYFRYTHAVVWVPMLAVLLTWTVFLVEVRFQVNLNALGIYPRKFSGLPGILFSPFIHGSIEHLYNNTLPLAVLLASLFYFYRDIASRVLIIGLLLSGGITWLIGRPSYHIGASSIIYLLASFIFFKGIFTKYYRLVALSLIVVFIYGGLLWYIFPVLDEISWEGHLGGFLTGLLLALTVKTHVPEAKKFAWEQEGYREEEDEFMRHFDEDGNFIEHSGNAPDKEDDPVEFKYIYKRNKGEDSNS